MPRVSVPADISVDSLAPRDAQPDPFAADSPIAFNALHERASVQKRAEVQIVQGIIPTYYNYSGPAAGTVVGIVLGSVAGFLLLVWLLYSLANINGGAGGGGGRRSNIQGEEEIVVRRRRNSQSGGRSRRSTRTEVREYSRSPRRRENIIVEERRQPARARSIVVEERARVPGDDVVEVIEEHEDYRSRRGSRRGGGGYR